MGRYIIGKIGVAISTSIVLSLLMSIRSYTPISEQKENVLHWLFSDLFMLFLIYSMPVILISGVPVSMLIDRFIRIKNSSIEFILRTIIYGFSGGLVFLILLIVLSSGKIFTQYLDDLDYTIIGIVAAILFYWIESVFRMIGRLLKNVQ